MLRENYTTASNPWGEEELRRPGFLLSLKLHNNHPPRWLTKATPLPAIMRDEDDEKVGIGHGLINYKDTKTKCRLYGC